MKPYIGCKIIKAEPATRDKVTGIAAHDDEDGYRVIYPDGYESWSPKSVFEEAYREVSVGEARLIDPTIVEGGR